MSATTNRCDEPLRWCRHTRSTDTGSSCVALIDRKIAAVSALFSLTISCANRSHDALSLVKSTCVLRLSRYGLNTMLVSTSARLVLSFDPASSSATFGFLAQHASDSTLPATPATATPARSAPPTTAVSSMIPRRLPADEPDTNTDQRSSGSGGPERCGNNRHAYWALFRLNRTARLTCASDAMLVRESMWRCRSLPYCVRASSPTRRIY